MVQKSFNSRVKCRRSLAMSRWEAISVDGANVETVNFKVESVNNPKSNGVCVSVGGEGFPSVGHNGERTTHPIVGITASKCSHSCGREHINLGVW